jgi:mono/diheme cytochrome c family protein
MKWLMTLVTIAASIAIAIPIAWADSAQANYTAFCVKCHGPTGHGDGPAAASLATKARDYTDCATMHKITDETLFKAIKSGGAAVGLPTDMPSWGNGLSDQEITDLVKFVRGFCKK